MRIEFFKNKADILGFYPLLIITVAMLFLNHRASPAPEPCRNGLAKLSINRHTVGSFQFQVSQNSGEHDDGNLQSGEFQLH